MKPANLKYPFISHERRILIEDRVWYLPGSCENLPPFTFPGWADPLLFGRERPISIEYCSGNGTWIAEKAQANPERHWVAVERKFVRTRKIWSKIKNSNLSNLLAVCGEGHSLTQDYLPAASVDEVYINFPDPWPKTRHAKHRLIQLPFMREILRILQPGGVVTMVTDDAGHSNWIIQIMQQLSGFESLFAKPYYVEDYPGYGTSFFEELWREKGKSIRYHVYRKIEGGA